LETDSPYLTPVPYRGRRNESAYVEYVMKKLAEVYETDCNKVSEQTTKNAVKLFDIPIKSS
jgi:TatD DNase family protein